VILNGAECEPYLTGDYRLMLEKPSEVIEGLRILMKVLGVQKGYIGIEDNKPEAVKSIQRAATGESSVEVCFPPDKISPGCREDAYQDNHRQGGSAEGNFPWM